MNEKRVESVADAIANLGYDGVAAFDRTEPEYDTITSLYEKYDNKEYVQLLCICATTEDYQLNGNAQRFWKKLTEVASNHGELASVNDVENILSKFMDAKVNSRLNSQKRQRLSRIYEADFGEWFVENHDRVAPLQVWEHLAEALNNDMEMKTVVLSMKIYDIAHFIQHGSYLEFPRNIPIPCDLQVERVSRTSGITRSESPSQVMAAWAVVMEKVSDQLNEHVSLLRIDSIVWQAGQIIGNNEPDRDAARLDLIDHFEGVGIEQGKSTILAEELTMEME